MARARKIQRNPVQKNFFLVDACFLVNRVLPIRLIVDPAEKLAVEESQEWWREIDEQLESGVAFIYVPDLCIAEAFKVLAKKHHGKSAYLTKSQYDAARKRLHEFLHSPTQSLKASSRKIKVHDISTCRDVIISVDRFFKTFLVNKLQRVGIIDLIVLATAKYLIDFYHIPKEQLYIVTQDANLWKGSKLISDVPTAFNPHQASERAIKVFV